MLVCMVSIKYANRAILASQSVWSASVVVKYLLMHSWGTSSVMDLRSLGVLGLGLSKSMLAGIGNSQRSSGHSILGRIPCWQTHALNIPGRPVLSTSFSHPSSTSQVFLMEAESLRRLSKIFYQALYRLHGDCRDWCSCDGEAELVCLFILLQDQGS